MDIRITAEVEGKDKVIFSTYAQPDGSVGLDLKGAQFFREENSGKYKFHEKESYQLSIHNSQKSATGNLITLKVTFRDEEKKPFRSQKWSTAIKQSGMSIAYSRLLPSLSGSSFEVDDGSKRAVRVDTFDREVSSLVLMIAAGSPHAQTNLEETQFYKPYSFISHDVQFVALVGILMAPATPHGDVLFFPTTKDPREGESSEEDEFLFIKDDLSARSAYFYCANLLYQKYIEKLGHSIKNDLRPAFRHLKPTKDMLYSSLRKGVASVGPLYLNEMRKISRWLRETYGDEF